MMIADLAAVVLTLAITVLTSVPLGRYMARVFQGRRTWLDPVLLPIERAILWLLRVAPDDSQDWRGYAVSLLVSNAVMWGIAWMIVTTQAWLPLNPDGIANMDAGAGLQHRRRASSPTPTCSTTAARPGLSYLRQMFMVTFLQFVTAATGMAALAAVIRALGGSRLTRLGHFYVDVTRASVRILLPLSIVVGTIALWQGTPMTFGGAVHATTLEGAPADDRARRGRGGGRDQAARHQRRRLLRAELGASVREPDAAHQPGADVGDRRRPDGHGLDPRGDDRPAATRGRALRDAARALRAAARRRRCGARPGAARRSPPPASPSQAVRSKARRSASGPRCRRSGPRRRPRPRTDR